MSDTENITSEPESQSFERCDQCGAPVDKDQRYCVNCGAHRRHVPDPAAKYLSRVSAHTGGPAGGGRVAPGGVLVTRRDGAFLGIGLLGALAIALIPIAAAVGVAIGRSSNNQDGKLIQALERQRAQVTTTYSAGSATSGSASSGSTGSSSTEKSSTTKKKSTAKSKSASSSTTSSTANGSVSKITGSKVTAAQQSQGSAEAKKIQNSTGSNYVQGANSLPSTIVVGP
jgi:hypothetical protein